MTKPSSQFTFFPDFFKWWFFVRRSTNLYQVSIHSEQFPANYDFPSLTKEFLGPLLYKRAGMYQNKVGDIHLMNKLGTFAET